MFSDVIAKRQSSWIFTLNFFKKIFRKTSGFSCSPSWHANTSRGGGIRPVRTRHPAEDLQEAL